MYIVVLIKVFLSWYWGGENPNVNTSSRFHFPNVVFYFQTSLQKN